MLGYGLTDINNPNSIVPQKLNTDGTSAVNFPDDVALQIQAANNIDRSGTITTGGTAQNLTPLSAGIVTVRLENPQDATEPLWYRYSGTATQAFPSRYLNAGDYVEVTIDTASQALSLIAATTGHQFYAEEV